MTIIKKSGVTTPGKRKKGGDLQSAWRSLFILVRSLGAATSRQEFYSVFEKDKLEISELEFLDIASRRGAIIRRLRELLGDDLALDLETYTIWEIENLHKQFNKTSRKLFAMHARIKAARSAVEIAED